MGSSDGGLGGEEAPPGLADEIVSALSPSTEYLVWVDSPEGRKAAKRAKAEMGVIGGLFGGNFRVRRILLVLGLRGGRWGGALAMVIFLLRKDRAWARGGGGGNLLRFPCCICPYYDRRALVTRCLG